MSIVCFSLAAPWNIHAFVWQAQPLSSDPIHCLVAVALRVCVGHLTEAMWNHGTWERLYSKSMENLKACHVILLLNLRYSRTSSKFQYVYGTR